jgi:hypothetical protein
MIILSLTAGERIVDPATKAPFDPDKEPERFAARIQDMKEILAALPTPKAGSLLALIEEWRGVPGTDGRPKRDPSPEWQALAPATRKSYERVIDPETGYLRRTVRSPLDKVHLPAITTPNVVMIRNKTVKKFGF